mmetsp:Transcript_24783/g.60887  ORF Transcript_24783/g.60887 Transcript_24783/m.60887 type:complete len:200 (+) Transcript_24783:76-675(+)
MVLFSCSSISVSSIVSVCSNQSTARDADLGRSCTDNVLIGSSQLEKILGNSLWKSLQFLLENLHLFSKVRSVKSLSTFLADLIDLQDNIGDFFHGSSSAHDHLSAVLNRKDQFLTMAALLGTHKVMKFHFRGTGLHRFPSKSDWNAVGTRWVVSQDNRVFLDGTGGEGNLLGHVVYGLFGLYGILSIISWMQKCCFGIL